LRICDFGLKAQAILNPQSTIHNPQWQ